MRATIKATSGTEAKRNAQATYGPDATITLIGKAEQRLLSLNRSSNSPGRRNITASHQEPHLQSPPPAPPESRELRGKSAFGNLQTGF